MRASKRVSRKSSKSTNRNSLSVERMEDRLLLAVDVFVQDGTLTIQGDRGDNTVSVDRPSREKISIIGDGKEIAFEFAELRNIKIDLGPGASLKRSSPGPRSILMFLSSANSKAISLPSPRMDTFSRDGRSTETVLSPRSP